MAVGGACSQSGAECADGGRGCPGWLDDACDTAVRTCRLRGDVTCNVQRYAQPLVPIAMLPAGATPLRNALGSVVPGGLTPMQPAVEGLLGHLQGLMAASGRTTGGLGWPATGCPRVATDSRSAPSPAAWRRRARQGPHLRIGAFASETLAESQPALAELARAGGGAPPFNSSIPTRA